MSNLKFYPVNLGCKVNAYETRAVSYLLIKEGYILGDKSHYDIVLINTCTVTHIASQKSKQQIRKYHNLNPKAIVVAMGCYANSHADELIKECGVNIVVGVNYRKEIPNLIKQFLKDKKTKIMVDSLSYIRNKIKYEELGIAQEKVSTRQYVKISDGCNNFCSYCIIPMTRGKLRSRNINEILKEIASLIKDGYKEIVLTGIDTSSYGKDFKNYSFSDLLEEILEKNPKLFRLRISSIEISEIDKKFLTLLKKYKNIANHIHVPLQSGSDTVLNRMNRKYDTKEYLSKIKAIRKVRKDIAITTDVIVGFPDESNKEFNETYNFIRKVKFYQLHVFPFSVREGTKASNMKDLNPKIKKERVNKLLLLKNKLEDSYKNRFLNKKMEVLFESNGNGLTSNYLKIKGNFKPNEVKKIIINKSNLE